MNVPTNQALYPGDESVDQMQNRSSILVHKLAEKFPTKTIVVISHGDPIW